MKTGGSSSGMKDGRWLKPCFKESSLLPEGETLQRNCWSFGGGHIVGEINFYFRLVFAHHSCGEHAQARKKKNKETHLVPSIIHGAQAIQLATQAKQYRTRNEQRRDWRHMSELSLMGKHKEGYLSGHEH